LTTLRGTTGQATAQAAFRDEDREDEAALAKAAGGKDDAGCLPSGHSAPLAAGTLTSRIGDAVTDTVPPADDERLSASRS
jgi:hypothetical protein